jgi:hypothetical protein
MVAGAMSEELRDAVRAVLEAARTLRHETKRTGEEPSPEAVVALWSAVDALDALMAKAIEYEGPMAWGKCIAGDEALGADGRYHKITGVSTFNLWATVDMVVQGRAKRYSKPVDLAVTIRRKLTPEADALSVLEAAGLDVTTMLSREDR